MTLNLQKCYNILVSKNNYSSRFTPKNYSKTPGRKLNAGARNIKTSDRTLRSGIWYQHSMQSNSHKPDVPTLSRTSFWEEVSLDVQGTGRTIILIIHREWAQIRRGCTGKEKMLVDERNFERAVQRALKLMGEKVQKQSASRHDNVIKRLQEEIERLRPQSERLLHGYSNEANSAATDGNKP